MDILPELYRIFCLFLGHFIYLLVQRASGNWDSQHNVLSSALLFVIRSFVAIQVLQVTATSIANLDVSLTLDAG